MFRTKGLPTTMTMHACEKMMAQYVLMNLRFIALGIWYRDKTWDESGGVAKTNNDDNTLSGVIRPDILGDRGIDLELIVDCCSLECRC